MKKIIALLLACVMLFSMASCNLIPSGNANQTTAAETTAATTPAETTPAATTPAETTPAETTPAETTTEEHIHEYVISEKESKKAKCTTDGLDVGICSCGAREERVVEALGHNMKVQSERKPSCTESGTTIYKCSRCTTREYVTADALGHNYEEATDPSRVIRCLNEGCTSCQWPTTSNGTHTEALTFNFTAEDEAEIETMYQELKALLEASPRYDATLHGFAEEGALADDFAAIDAKHTEYYELIMNAVSQRQLAEIAYYCNMKDETLKETNAYMMDYYTAIVAQFYTLSRPFYDSCYREFYYQGMSEEEINAFLFDSDAISNPEYTALKERNNEIETELLALSAGDRSTKLPEMYAEFAANNNKMAQIMGYEIYLEYAYENVYGREYTYQDAAELSEYVKVYLSPVFNQIYRMYQGMSSASGTDRERYENQTKYSFFSNYEGNAYVNDYIDLLAFTSNPDKQYSFSDEFDKLMSDGNMFRGQYQGAFVTTITGVNIPIAYFGSGYDSASTIVHEFGHFMNEIYSANVAEANNNFSQSYDLLEMHSQGNELLYLCYLEENVDYSEVTESLIRLDSLVNMLYAIMAGMTIDTFERAIYLDTYTGLNADIIMADGTITQDEYKSLYKSICADYGVESLLGTYWEYGMTITSPCYYVSYSISAIAVLQLYEVAKTDGFDVAKDAYLKLFTYVDEDPMMNFEGVLEYAGLLSFNDEQLYINLNEYFLKK